MKRIDIIAIIAKLEMINKKSHEKINAVSKRETHFVKEVATIIGWHEENIAENEGLIAMLEKELEGIE